MRLSRNAVAGGVMLAGAAAVLAVSRFLPSRRIDGQAVFITGGSRGLGLALALEYARRGTVVPGKPVVQLPKEPADTPYAHPRYWAAFILLGDPE